MKNFIDKLADKGLFLVAQNEDLMLRSKNGDLSEEQIAQIREDKSITTFIRENKSALIEAVKKQVVNSRFYKLSPLQEGILFHHLYDKESKAYLEQLRLDFPAGVNVEILKKSLNKVVSNYSILRTSFIYDQGQIPVQHVADKVECPFEELDYSGASKEEQEQMFNEFLEADVKRGLDMQVAPLMRVTLVDMGEDAYKMVWTSHHILLDGWSVAIVMAELIETYEMYIKGETPPEKEDDKYEDFIKYLSQQDEYEEERFWKSYMEGFNENTLLPFVRKSEGHNSGASVAKVCLDIDQKFSSSIKAYCQKYKLTVNTLFQGIWSVILASYTGKNQVAFGVPASGRPADFPKAEERVGLYLNTLPFFVEINKEANITDWLNDIQLSRMEAREFQYTSLNKIKQWTGTQGDFFDNILVFENYPIGDAIAGDERSLKIENVVLEEQSNYLLNISVVSKDTMHIIFRYNEDLMETVYVEGMKRHFENVLQQIVEGEATQIADLEVNTASEKQQLLEAFNDNYAPFPEDMTVVDLFQVQARKAPKQIALDFGGETLTYEELDSQSDKLAAYLIFEQNIKSGDFVGIMIQPSNWMIVSILGVLKAGAAYVPIGLDYPATRRNHIIEDTDLKALIIESESLFDVMDLSVKIISVDIQIDEFEEIPEEYCSLATQDKLAYALFTSGSTGTPKGVKVGHRNLMNYVCYGLDKYGDITEFLSFPLFTPITFDLTQTSILLTLLSGGTLFIQTGDDVSKQMESILANEKINALKLTPSHVGMIKEDASTNIATFILGGEELLPAQIKKLYKMNPDAVVINEYGPTEATVGCTVWEAPKNLPDDDFVSIGSPIANTAIYILNDDNELLPIGVVGELCVGGTGVTQGYVNRPDLTEANFIENPFSADDSARIYKTGDLARWAPNGQLEMMGRKDDQVKIRGHRIELGEVKHSIQNYPQVDEAYVLCREREDIGKELVAYYQPSFEQCYSLRKIQENKDLEIDERIKLVPLPNGMEMYSYNKFEMEFVYDEIFTNNVYFRNDITLEDGSVVIDIGANSGMFSVLANMVAKDVTVYAYEPLPPTYEILKLNTGIFPGNYKLHNFGISSKEEIATFNYYPFATVLSSRSATEEEVTETVRQFIYNSEGFDPDQITEEELNALLAEKLVTEEFECQLKTVSTIIKDNGLTQIDYLKIDVEDAEMDVLEGIKDEDWPKIRQFVIEVHDVEGRLDAIKQLLAKHGFAVTVNQSSDAQNTHLYDLYAISESLVMENMVNKPEPIDPNKWQFTTSESLRDGLKNYLKESLPDYMVPSMLIEMGRFPLTRNGKVDKKALPIFDASELVTHNYVEPRNKVETEIARVWKNLLKVDQVGATDDFFELGGHSLLATRVVSSIKSQFGVELGVNDIFTYPTVEALAKKVSSKERGQALPLIEAVTEKPERMPLSFAQERLWFIDKLAGSAHYHLPYVQAFSPELDVDAMEYALNEIVNRHEVLRTVICEENGKAYQLVLPKDTWKLDLVTSESSSMPEQMDSLVEAETRIPFNLAKDHMMRAKLIKYGNEGYLFIATTHHIASDGWSSGILLEEFVKLYNAKNNNQTADLPTLTLQYSDYAIWQKENFTSELLESKLDYWEEQLADVEPINLPTDYQRPSFHSLEGNSFDFTLNKNVSNQLKELANKENVSLFMLLLSAYKVFLSRYSGQTDICVGTSIANRPQKELESLIGYFVNTIALRSNLDGNPNFTELVAAVKETTLDAYQNVQVPFEKVVGRIDKERDQSRSSLFQVLFVMDNNSTNIENGLGDLIMDVEPFHPKIAKFDLTFFVSESEDGLNCSINYCTDLFAPETIARMQSHFENLLNAIVQNPQQEIASLEMLGSTEKQELLSNFNPSTVSYDSDRSILELFEEQVKKNPDTVAFSFDQTQVTYQEFDEKTTQIAQYLKATYDLNPNDLVGVMVDTSIWTMLAMVGILKAGAAYVPIDKEIPLPNKKYIVDDTQVKALIIDSDSLFEVVDFNVPILALNLQYDEIAEQDNSAVELSKSKGENLAYVIYTSGTTGQPKGVMVSHQNVVDYYLGLDEAIDIKANKSFGLMSALTADLGNTVLFGSMLSGGTLHLFSKKLLMNADLLQAYFKQFPVDCIKIVASHWNALTVDDALLLPERMIIFGGEVLPPEFVNSIRNQNPDLAIVNHYGPTETTIGKLLYQVDENNGQSNIPIGKPFSNTQVYVVDQNLNACPVGVPGELLIGGDGVAIGYVNNPEQTAERFISNPFSANNDDQLYRTGDLVKWLPDGNISYIGRTDDQIKIRGYRVELGGITKVLQACPQVNQGLVTVKTDDYRNKKLIAYVVPEGAFNKEAILNFLTEELPEYMLPVHFVELESMPLTSNGKVNKKALPDVDQLEDQKGEYTPPRNELEEKLTSIWTDLLHIGAIGVHKNFFELGGDSIIAIQVVSRVKRLGYHMQVQDLFENSTIADLAVYIEENSSGDGIIAEQGQLSGAAPLTPIQHWFFNKELDNPSYFNQAVFLEVNKNVPTENLQKVLEVLVERHDALRFYYKSELSHMFATQREWSQNYGTAKGQLEMYDCSEATQDSLKETIEAVCQERQVSMDIEKEKMTQFVLFQTPAFETHNRLFMAIHHLAVDGVSWRILMDEMETLLNQMEENVPLDLGPKTTSYRAWSDSLTAYAETEKVEDQLTYWQNIQNAFKEAPVDFQADTVLWSEVEKHSISLDKQTTTALLNEVNHAFNTEINDILVSALAKTVGQWTDNEDVVIGLEGHGREEIFRDVDISNTVGWFTNKYPVLLSMTNANDEGNLIKSVKEQLRTIPEKGIGYGCLKYLNPSKTIRSGLNKKAWDIDFNYLGQFDNSTNTTNRFSLAKEDAGASVSPDTKMAHKLEIVGSVSNGQLNLTWHYSQSVFKPETIENLAKEFQSNLVQLIQFCRGREVTESTPTDFGLNGDMSYQELDSLFSANEVEDEDGVIKF